MKPGLNISVKSVKYEPGDPGEPDNNGKSGDTEEPSELSDAAQEPVEPLEVEDEQDEEEDDDDENKTEEILHEAETFRRNRFLENMQTDTGARYSDLDNLCIFFDEKTSTMGKKCLLNLGKIDIDIVVDEVLTENFCDQEGRLVCLICYKIMGQNEFQVRTIWTPSDQEYNLEFASCEIYLPNLC